MYTAHFGLIKNGSTIKTVFLRVLSSVESYRSDVKYDLTFGPDVNEVIWIITDSSNKRTLISNEPNQVNDTVRGRW